jgi:multisubunit Na+/H+ antiporter MnhB subunit
VDLGKEAPPDPSPTPPGRTHGLAITGMALFAIAGVITLVALITVNWTEEASRYLIVAFVGAGIGFLASASVAVLSAARDTYRSSPVRDRQRDRRG